MCLPFPSFRSFTCTFLSASCVLLCHFFSDTSRYVVVLSPQWTARRENTEKNKGSTNFVVSVSLSLSWSSCSCSFVNWTTGHNETGETIFTAVYEGESVLGDELSCLHVFRIRNFLSFLHKNKSRLTYLYCIEWTVHRIKAVLLVNFSEKKNVRDTGRSQDTSGNIWTFTLKWIYRRKHRQLWSADHRSTFRTCFDPDPPEVLVTREMYWRFWDRTEWHWSRHICMCLIPK